jgi:hypothetical protein
MNNGLYNQVNMPVVGDPMAAQMQMENKQNQMAQNQINPKAFSNTAAIEGMYGNANPNTFTRTLGPLTPPVDPNAITPTPNFNNI